VVPTAPATASRAVPARFEQVPFGKPVATLTASSASQSPAGTGLTITWAEAPEASFLKAPAAQQAADAQAVDQYLTTLLTNSYNDYQAQLNAQRIPPTASTPLTKSWAVRVTGVSTQGSLMTFEVSEATPPAGTKTFTEIAVPSALAPLNAATAPAALRSMLYYTKNVA
jgi:hypothetical protein